MALFLTRVNARQAACKNKEGSKNYAKRVGGGFWFFSPPPPFFFLQHWTCGIVANSVTEVAVSLTREQEDCSGKIVMRSIKQFCVSSLQPEVLQVLVSKHVPQITTCSS